MLTDSGGFGISVVYEMCSMHQNIYCLVTNASVLLSFALQEREKKKKKDAIVIALSGLLLSLNSVGLCLLQLIYASVYGVPIL